MAREFQRGHKAKISDLTAGTDLYVGVQIAGPGLTFDISCFGLDADEQLSDDRYFVFFNQPKSPEESIQLLGAQAGDTESFRVTLDRIPAQIQKLSFTATIDGAGQMSQIAPGYVRIVAGGEEVARYSFNGAEFSTERAVMLGDFYLKDVWRFAAVGQGFDGGLDALLKNFGGEVAEEEPAAQQPQRRRRPAFAPPAAGRRARAGLRRPAPHAPQPAPPFGAPAPRGPAVRRAPMHAAPTIAAPAARRPAVPCRRRGPAPVRQPPGQPAAAEYGQGTRPGQLHAAWYGQPAATAPRLRAAPGAVPGQRPSPSRGRRSGVPQGAPQAAPVCRPPSRSTRRAPTGQRWTQQNQQLVRVDLTMGASPSSPGRAAWCSTRARSTSATRAPGSPAGSSGNATGQEMQLMRCSGRRPGLPRRRAPPHLHPIELQGDAHLRLRRERPRLRRGPAVRGPPDRGRTASPAARCSRMQFQGTGTVVVKTHGVPVVLPVTPDHLRRLQRRRRLVRRRPR